MLELLGRTSLLERLKLLWPANREDLEIDVLRDWFFEFPYMERLRDEQVLADAISAVVADISDEGLGLASGKNDAGKYTDLQLHKRIEPRFGTGALLVRNAIARAQYAKSAEAAPVSRGDGEGSDRAPRTGELDQRKPKRFVGAIELDALRGLAKAGQVFESVINELDRAPGTNFQITLEISANSELGFPEDVQSVVSDNASTLGFSDKRFD